MTASYIKDRFLIERKAGFGKGIVDCKGLPICHIYNDWEQGIQIEEVVVGMMDEDLNNLRDDATNQEVNVSDSNVYDRCVTYKVPPTCRTDKDIKSHGKKASIIHLIFIYYLN